MNRLEKHYYDIGYLDTLAAGGSFLHRLNPRAKLLTTLVFTVTVVSFGKYEISALVPYIIYPVFLISLGNLPPGYIFRKVLLVSPFAVIVGIFNPILDPDTLVTLGNFTVSGGWISFISILLRFALTVGAAMILIALTGFNDVCMALEQLGAPRFFALQLLFLYRYIFVLMDEGVRMVRARALRTFGGRGLGLATYASLLGHLLLRTLDRAQRIYSAMWCRGFDGTIRTTRRLSFGRAEYLFVASWTALFVTMRFYNIPLSLGEFLGELIG